MNLPTTKLECAHCGGKNLDLDYMEESDENSGRLIFCCDDCDKLTRVTFIAVEKEEF